MTTISKGVTRDFQITGVFKDIPKNSSLKADAIQRLDFNSFFAQEPQFLTCWSCQSGWVYFKLKPGTDVKQLEAQEPAWEKRNIPDQPNGAINYNPGDRPGLALRQLARRSSRQGAGRIDDSGQ